jgi:hypothetical protein
MSFLNPYDFIPFENADAGTTRFVSRSMLRDIDHSVYAGISGRVVFRLTNPRTPLFIGASRDADSENGIRRYRRYEVLGHPAIPGSTLRGLVSSLYEALTNSAMRVASDRELSSHGGSRLFDRIDAIDKDLRPLHPARTSFTPAELLFGYVDDLRGTTNQLTRAQCGRVRFGDARATFLPQDSRRWVTLKFQNAPNPQCSVLYFDQDGRPNGRKAYLHSDAPGVDHWTEARPNANRNIQIQPLPPGCVFWGHLDFDNLLPEELRMLLAAFRPAESFMHRLGRAKPFGFGSVQLSPVGLLCVTRNPRYGRNGLSEGRYSKASRFLPGVSPDAWPDKYAREAEAARGGRPAELRIAIREALAAVPPRTLNAICLLGDPGSSDLPVKYPGNVWLDQNKDLTWPLRLGQITAESAELPAFPDHPSDDL